MRFSAEVISTAKECQFIPLIKKFRFGRGIAVLLSLFSLSIRVILGIREVKETSLRHKNSGRIQVTVYTILGNGFGEGEEMGPKSDCVCEGQAAVLKLCTGWMDGRCR